MENSKLIKSCPKRDLPKELWHDILSRLPVKFLLRSRCVSPSWLSWIDDPEFARLHLKTFKNNRDQNHLLIVQGRRNNCAVWSHDTFEPTSETLLSIGNNIQGSWRFVCSVHGLVLLETVSKRDASMFKDLKVWNPSIRKFHEIASLPEIEIPPNSSDPKTKIPPNSHFRDPDLGLGYDPVANDYKHVKLMYVHEILHTVAVYSLRSGSWKMISFEGKECSWRWDSYTIPWKKKLYLRGSLYFVCKICGDTSHWELVSYHLSSEEFSYMSMPDDPYFKRPDFKWQSEIVLVDGGCSVAVLDTFSPKQKSLWVLETSSGDEGESMCWTKRYSFQLNFLQFLCFRKNGDLLTRSGRKKKSVNWDEVGSFSPDTQEYKIVKEKKASRFLINHVSPYFESLFLLK